MSGIEPLTQRKQWYFSELWNWIEMHQSHRTSLMRFALAGAAILAAAYVGLLKEDEWSAASALSGAGVLLAVCFIALDVATMDKIERAIGRARALEDELGPSEWFAKNQLPAFYPEVDSRLFARDRVLTRFIYVVIAVVCLAGSLHACQSALDEPRVATPEPSGSVEQETDIEHAPPELSVLPSTNYDLDDHGVQSGNYSQHNARRMADASPRDNAATGIGGANLRLPSPHPPQPHAWRLGRLSEVPAATGHARQQQLSADLLVADKPRDDVAVASRTEVGGVAHMDTSHR